MNKPDDVSQEALDEAWQIYLLTRGETDKGVEAIARAIMAARLQEREECAVVAENYDGWAFYDDDAAATCNEIAERIRARK